MQDNTTPNTRKIKRNIQFVLSLYSVFAMSLTQYYARISLISNQNTEVVYISQGLSYQQAKRNGPRGGRGGILLLIVM